MARKLKRDRNILIIVMGLIIAAYMVVLGFPAIQFPEAQPEPGYEENPEEEVVTNQNFEGYYFSEDCVGEELGADRFAVLKSGTVLLTNDEWSDLSACLVAEQKTITPVFLPPGVFAGQNHGVVMTGFECVPGLLKLQVMNLPKTGNISTEGKPFKLNGFLVECRGIPLTIEPGESAECSISEFVFEGYNTLEMPEFTPALHESHSFPCPGGDSYQE